MITDRLQSRLLVVDDDKSSIELIANVFANDYEVLFALDGETALKVALTSVPDLILLDVLLPGMDGFETRVRLQAEPLTCDIPTIFITALGDIEAETKGLALGAVDYIAKPINPPLVALRVKNHIELKRSRDRLAQLATLDGLTGLANRRRFDEVLATEFARHQRSARPLTLMMLDIDHFKAFNDSYGHVQGDDCLCSVAKVIAEQLYRGADLAARYGGEEFACILPEISTLDGVKAVAERIRGGVIERRIPHNASPTAPWVTVSIGAVSACCRREATPVDLVAKADTYLYRAKAAGRNCSDVATDIDC